MPDTPITPHTPISLFISYSHADSAFVDQLEADLHKQGFDPWIDRQRLAGGQRWRRELQEAVKGAQVLLLVLSPEAAVSQNVQIEYDYVLDLGKVVIPLYLRQCDIPMELHNIQWIDFRHSYEQGLAALVSTLQQQQTQVAPPAFTTVEKTPEARGQAPATNQRSSAETRPGNEAAPLPLRGQPGRAEHDAGASELSQLANDAGASTATQSGKLQGIRSPSGALQGVGSGIFSTAPPVPTGGPRGQLEQPPAAYEPVLDETGDVELLERERYLEQLSQLFHTAATGHGRTVLISGEAGIGKTALVERFVNQQCKGARRLWGACEDLFTPRPLGPLYDIAAQTRGSLSMLMSRDTPRPMVFSALLEELQTSAMPNVVVFEDVHWADEATLDLIKFLGRRIPQLATLFINTYRDDELSLDHPLRSVFGDLPSKAVARLRLAPLSEQAVARLAQREQRPVEELYAITGGNPFFVTEVLASETAGTPMNVSDAVLARIAHLSPTARALLELASVVPARSERWLLEAVLGSDASALEECLNSGMLILDEAVISFRHELARQAVESTLSPLRRQGLHAQVLQALLAHGVEASQSARLVHHAMGAQDVAMILRYAPLAAQQASAKGAHREAAAQYATALRYADQLPAERQAELFEGRAYECYLTYQEEEAVQARQEALRIWRQLKRTEKIGHTLRWLSRLSWVLGKRGDAEQYAEEAVHILEALPPGTELAMAYSNRAQLAMLAWDDAEAVQWGERAIALAESLGDVETLVHALNNVGCAQINAQEEQGRAKLERSLRLALEHGLEEHAARAYTNMATVSDVRAYSLAARYLREGIAYCAEHDLDTFLLYMQAHQAFLRCEQGAWDEASAEATHVLDRYRLAPPIKIPALVALSSVQVRRGDAGSAGLLEEARDLALATGEVQRIAPVAILRAEAAWLQGNKEQCLAEARVGYEMALVHKADPWTFGELCIWMWRGGGLNNPPGPIAEPYARQIAGDWQAAAALWAEIGCPYEQALALADGDVAAKQSALSILERLGAKPAIAIVRQQMP